MGGEGVIELFAIAGALMALGVVVQSIRRRPGFIIALLLVTITSALMSFPTAEFPPGYENRWSNFWWIFFASFFFISLLVVPVSVIAWHVVTNWKMRGNKK